MKNYLKAGIGFTVALGIIGLFTYWVGWEEIIFGLSQAQLRYAIPAAVIAFTGLTLLGVSWWIAVRDVIDMGLFDGVKLFFVTFFANSVTPLGQFGGEPFIAYIVSRDADIPMEESLGAIVIADIINSIPFFTMSLVGIFVFLIFYPLDSLISLILKIVVSLAVVLLATVVLIGANQQRALRFLGAIGATVQRTAKFFDIPLWDPMNGITRETMIEKGETFFEIIGTLLQKRRMLYKASIIAHVQALLGTVALYLFILSLDVALHPGVEVPFSALLFIMPASMLAGYLPLPGGLGGIEVAMVGLLVAITGLPAAPASAAVLMFRFFTYWAGLLLGGYFGSQMSVDVLANAYTGD